MTVPALKNNSMDRRKFLTCALASGLAVCVRAAETRRKPIVLLRSSWQVIDIGDVAPTPGVLAHFEPWAIIRP
jgi:hypothetical protein